MALIILITAGYIIYKSVYLNEVNEQQIEQQRSLYYGDNEPTPADNSSGLDDKFLRLYAANPDIRSWISMLGTSIDYPVYQSPADDPEFYLTHNAQKQKHQHGSIYMDSRIKLDENPNVIILYGHDMNDNSMFHDLLKYKDLDFYKENPVFSFDTIKEEGSWKVFSVFATNTYPEQGTVFEYQRTSFADDEDFLDFVSQLNARSLIDTGVDVQASDQLLILSTCSYEHKGFRTVVVARKIRQTESPAIDTGDARYAANPVKPDVCKGCSHGQV